VTIEESAARPSNESNESVPALEVRNLRTSFPSKAGPVRVVDGVDLRIAAGRTLCLVGESGSGKSVTAMSITGLIDRPASIASDSSVRLAGRELVGLPERRLREVRGSGISMIFQEPMTSLNPLFTIGEQIAETLRRHQGLGRRQARERALELLRTVGISAPERRAHSYPHQLSGGMRQRVMIAMAISCNPAVLIADEPTTALDVTIQGQILTVLKELQERLGTAILLITHDLGVVSQIADDVAVMYAGRVVETAPVEELFAAPRHPYTSALIRSVPVVGLDKSKPLYSIPGAVPNPARWPAGCRFADRCANAIDVCTTRYPQTVRSGSRSFSCWAPEPDSSTATPTATTVRTT
jgi:oligopeptide/dipeptide ABC transporter ATP-binding protein